MEVIGVMGASEGFDWFLSIRKNPFIIGFEAFYLKSRIFMPYDSQFGPLKADAFSHLVFYGLLSPNKYQ